MRRNVNIFEHRVLFPVIQDRAGQSRHDLVYETPCSTADNQKAEECPVRTIATDDPVHEDQHQRCRQWPDDRIEQEEPGIGPVALGLPFKPCASHQVLTRATPSATLM